MIDEKNGKEAIQLLTKIGNNFNVRVALEFGTLLGQKRNNSFIPHDGDVDVGMLFEQWDTEILDSIKDAGFGIGITSNWHNRTLSIVGKKAIGKLNKLRLNYKGVNICFNIWHTGVGKLTNTVFFAPPRKTTYIIQMPKKLMVKQKLSKLYDLDVWIPEDDEGYVKFVYGDEWEKPIVRYNKSSVHMFNSKRFYKLL